MVDRDAIRFIFAEVGFRRDDPDIQYFADVNDHMERSRFQLCGFYDIFRCGRFKEFVHFANALYALLPGFSRCVA
jgi:hypothetical protein